MRDMDENDNRYTLEVLTELQNCGATLSDGLKCFVQACVIATQIEVDCIDRVILYYHDS